MAKKFQVFLDALQKEYFQKLLLTGLKNTILIAVLGLLIGIVLGTIIAMVKVAPKYKWYMKVLNTISNIYVEFFRGTPMMVQSFFMYYGLKSIGLNWTPIVAGIVIISINTGAYMAEIVRSGIQAVDKGQTEGARSVGMSHLQTMFYIIIPQAIRNSFPSIINEFIVNIKDSSVLNVIAVNDLYFQGSSVAGSVFKYTETFFVVAMIYLCLTYPTSKILGWIEKRMANTTGKVGA